jgi:hypothetical protein
LPAQSDSETITIIVNEVNAAPVLGAIGNTTVNEGTVLSFTASATDPDTPAQRLTFSLDGTPPAGTSIDSATGAFSWTPSESQGPSTNSITIRVTDSGLPAQSDSKTFSIAVNEVNAAPVLGAIGSKTVREGTLLSFQVNATDSDTPPQTLSFSLDAGAPVGATIDPNTGLFNWRPSESDGPGTPNVTIRVTDNGSPARDDFETIVIAVTETNTPPLLGPIGNKTIDEGSQLTFTATASDPDTPGQTLTFSLGGGAPAGASIHPTTGVFAWTPAEVQGPNTNSVTIRVTDNGSPAQSDSKTISIVVNEVNAAPVLAAIGDKSVNEGSALSFTATATDLDLPSQTLTFSLEAGAPSGASIHPTTGAFSWTPTEAQGPGTNSVTIRVTDNGSPAQSDSETIRIVVNEVNAAPVLAAIGNKAINEGSMLSFTASATDPDLPSQTLTFSLEAGAPSGASIHPTTGAFSWTPTEAQGPSTNPVTIRVTDNGSPAQSDFETINIVVNEVNVAPVLAPIGNKTVKEGTLLSFQANATDSDSPTQTLIFSLDAGAPAGAGINPNSGVFTWTPTGAQGPSTNNVIIRVRDNGSPLLDDFENIAITVTETNTPPLLAPIGNKTIDEGSELAFTASASDSDTPAQSLTYSLGGSVPAGASIHPSTGLFSWTPAETQGPGTNSLTVIVTDNGSPAASASETISIVVTEVNAAPVLAAIGNKSVNEGSTLNLTATASDGDLPRQTLTFSLDAGAPGAASIDPTTGAFSWTPTEAQGPSTNAVTIRVTDNGSPARSDSETISIIVTETNAVPVLTAVAVVNGLITLRWTSTPQRRYQIQYTRDFGISWNNVGPEIMANDVTTSYTAEIGAVWYWGFSQFYRVMQLE